MGKIGTYTWTGVSGRKYVMDAYTLDTQFIEGIEGNYVFAKPGNNEGHIDAVYIGEGKLKDRIEFRINDGCVLRKGADRVCVRVEGNEQIRKSIEDDLLEANTCAYAPIGCNVKIGG